METLIEKQISVITCDGRNIIGTLKGIDQSTNMVIEKCIENVYSQRGVQQISHGLYLIRGNNVVLVGEFEGKYFKENLNDIKVYPMKEIEH